MLARGCAPPQYPTPGHCPRTFTSHNCGGFGDIGRPNGRNLVGRAEFTAERERRPVQMLADRR